MRVGLEVAPRVGMEILRYEQQAMQAALRVRSVRADLLAGNIANADTPGYLSRDLKFGDALEQALNGSGGADVLSSDTIARENIRFDRNDTDLGEQLAKSYENAVDYVATLKLYGDSMGRLTTAASSS